MQVVPDFSSALGDPREHAEPLDANHMEMCRMTSQDDPNYRKVSGELKIWYESVCKRFRSAVLEATEPRSDVNIHDESGTN